MRPPTVLSLQQRTVRLGEPVILHCDVFSMDTNTKINWTRDNDLVQLDGNKYRALPVLRDEKLSTFSSDLIIYDVQSSDLGRYGCFGQNEMGNDHKDFILEEEHTTDWIAIAITINTIMAVMCMFGYIFWIKRVKIMKWIRGANHNESQLPVVQREVLPPIYRGQDQSVFEELLLGTGMTEKDYLKLSQEYQSSND